jgi:hypothetical protein
MLDGYLINIQEGQEKDLEYFLNQHSSSAQNTESNYDTLPPKNMNLTVAAALVLESISITPLE